MAQSARTELFPLGVATGAAFCDRDAERRELKSNILAGTHTWLMGIRRYGKTSLVCQVAEELARKRKPRVHVESTDLFVVHNIRMLDALLREAVGRLSAQLLPRNRRVLGHLQKVFAAFKPELTLSEAGVSLRLFSATPGADSILRLLEALDAAAEHYRRRAVLVIDEFQQIAEIDNEHTIEGAIRNVAQRSKALSFVFLGSERTLLAQMFEDANRPLYRLCAKMELDRIGAAEYEAFITEASTLRWSRVVSGRALQAILMLTDRHPYYLNLLCQTLWQRRAPPSEATVHDQWAQLLQRERHQAHQAMMALANAQRAVLAALAQQPTDKPTSQRYLGQFGIAGSTMLQAIDVLADKDFIRRDANGVYEVVDPLVKGFLTR